MHNEDFGAKDHTRLVEAVFDNAAAIIRNLRPTPEQVLMAALDVEEIDPETKRMMRRALGAHAEISRARTLLPPRVAADFAAMEHALLATETVEQARAVLHRARRTNIAHDEEAAWNRALDLGMEMLADGERTIYSGAHVARTLARQGLGRESLDGKGFAKAVAGADVAGAIGGALATFYTGALSLGAAALAGATVSAGAAIVVGLTS